MCKYSFLTHKQLRCGYGFVMIQRQSKVAVVNVSQRPKYLPLTYEPIYVSLIWTIKTSTVDYQERSHQILIWGFKRPSH